MHTAGKKTFKRVFIYVMLATIMAACGGSGGGDNQNSSSTVGADTSTTAGNNNLKASFSLVKQQGANDYGVMLDLGSLASQLKIDHTSLLKIENCEQNNQPNFGDVVVKLTKGSVVKTLFLPVACKNIVDTKLYDIDSGMWSVEVIVYNHIKDELLVAKTDLNVGQTSNVGKDIFFNKAVNQNYYEILKKMSDVNLAQEVHIVPTDYMKTTEDSFIYLGSTDRDYIGGGQEYLYLANEFSLSGYKNRLMVDVSGSDNSDWTGSFALPDSYKALAVGLFPNLLRYSFSNPKIGGLEWTGNGRACNTSKSWMRVDQITLENDALRSIDYRFAQHCEEDPYSALFGMVHWKSPRLTIGTQWQPSLEAVPIGNYIALESDQGDYVGGGKDYLFHTNNANINLDSQNNVFNVSVNGDTWWNAGFALPDTQTKIVAGTYKNLIRYPFHNPKLGGLDWGGDGRGCNQLEGWFIVDNVKYDTAGLQAIDLRFEQHCEGDVPALYGKIHWTREGT